MGLTALSSEFGNKNADFSVWANLYSFRRRTRGAQLHSARRASRAPRDRTRARTRTWGGLPKNSIAAPRLVHAVSQGRQDGRCDGRCDVTSRWARSFRVCYPHDFPPKHGRAPAWDMRRGAPRSFFTLTLHALELLIARTSGTGKKNRVSMRKGQRSTKTDRDDTVRQRALPKRRPKKQSRRVSIAAAPPTAGPSAQDSEPRRVGLRRRAPEGGGVTPSPAAKRRRISLPALAAPRRTREVPAGRAACVPLAARRAASITLCLVARARAWRAFVVTTRLLSSSRSR